MKKKLLGFLLAVVMCIGALGIFAACGESPSPEGTDTKPAAVPTAAQVVLARENAVKETVQGYDFTLTFTGNFSVLGLGTSLDGKYQGSYRYDSATDEVAFKRVTSGSLLYDSTAYVFTSGDSRIKMTMKDGEVKKLSVEIPEEQNITMVNLPIVALVNSIQANNIKSVSALKNSSYAYSCPLTLNANNPACDLINQVFEKLGTGVSFKGIKLNANVSTLDFNMKDDKINDFRFSFNMGIEVKKATVNLNVTYAQKGSSTKIAPPAAAGIVYQTSAVQQEVNAINAAIADLKDDPAYSLDLTAKNEFDPGWNKLATTDSYTARMYKNTDTDGNAWFNHSYYYKAHSQKDGKETYKYTIGNVNGTNEDNQGTWLISRKSTNTQTRAAGVTANTQFDFLTSMVKLNANEVDCIKKQVNGATTVYKVYLGRTGTKGVQQKIINMINTNKYDPADVIAVNNYYNDDNLIKESEIEITLTNGKISSIKCDTKLCYTPTGGDYTEYNITLDNTIELLVNKNLDKAQKYTPPTKVKGTLGIGKNLNDSEFYIL